MEWVVDEIVQWVKAFAAHLLHLCWNLQTHKVGEENWLLQTVLWMPHVYYCVHSYTKYMKIEMELRTGGVAQHWSTCLPFVRPWVSSPAPGWVGNEAFLAVKTIVTEPENKLHITSWVEWGHQSWRNRGEGLDCLQQNRLKVFLHKTLVCTISVGLWLLSVLQSLRSQDGHPRRFRSGFLLDCLHHISIENEL